MNCKGSFYRYRENTFKNSKGEMVFTKRFSPLKRLSCKGCENCIPIREFLSDWFGETSSIDHPLALRDGNLCELTTRCTNQGGYSIDPPEYEPYMKLIPCIEKGETTK